MFTKNIEQNYSHFRDGEIIFQTLFRFSRVEKWQLASHPDGRKQHPQEQMLSQENKTGAAIRHGGVENVKDFL